MCVKGGKGSRSPEQPVHCVALSKNPAAVGNCDSGCLVPSTVPNTRHLGNRLEE